MLFALSHELVEWSKGKRGEVLRTGLSKYELHDVHSCFDGLSMNGVQLETRTTYFLTNLNVRNTAKAHFLKGFPGKPLNPLSQIPLFLRISS